MTPMQQRFVQEYPIDLNSTQAAIRAGYSAKTAPAQASRLLTNVNVAAAIAARMDKRAEKAALSAERVLDEIMTMAFLDPKDIVTIPLTGPADIASLPENVRRAIVGWKWTEHGFEIKLADKSRALDQLARHLSIYNDKLNVNATVGLADRVKRARERVDEIERRGAIAVIAPDNATGVDVVEIETGIHRAPNAPGETLQSSFAPAPLTPRPTRLETAAARHEARQAAQPESRHVPLTYTDNPESVEQPDASGSVTTDYNPYGEE